MSKLPADTARGAGDYWIVLSLLLSRVVYKLIDRRTPISRKEKRWYVYIGVGYAIWAFSGDWLRTPIDTIQIWFWATSWDWLDTPPDARIKTYALWKLLHLAIGAGVVGVCRWDYMRTFHPNQPTTNVSLVNKTVQPETPLMRLVPLLFGVFVVSFIILGMIFGMLLFFKDFPN